MRITFHKLARYFSLIGLTTVTTPIPLHADTLFESFDGWSKPSYQTVSTYSNAASGVWYTENTVVRSDDPVREPAVRFNRFTEPAPFLMYQGLSGDGIYGGIKRVAFDYAHWNGQGSVVRFQLQYSTNAIDWVALDDEVNVRDPYYNRYSWEGELLDEPLFLRVQSTAHSERLFINDFEIQLHLGARILLATNTLFASVSEQLIEIPVWIEPPSDGTVDIDVVAGDAWRDVIFTLQETQLVFTAAAPTQTVQVALIDTATVIPDPTIVFALTNAVNAIPLPDDQFALTIWDSVLPRASLTPSTAAILESGDPLELRVSLTQPGDATVNVHRAGSAVEGVDYTLSTTQLVFEAEGPTAQSFTLTPIDNDIGDGDCTVILTLNPLEGASAGDTISADIVIIDDEPFAHFAEPDAWLSVGDEPHVVAVTLDEARDAVVHIDVLTDALADWHYHLSATTLVFAAEGPTTQSVEFTPLDHGESVPPQRVRLQLAGNQGFQTGTNNTHYIGIRSHLSVLVAAANLTSGSTQRYEEPGRRLLRGLMPDVVGIQEFRVHGTRREFVDQVFGTNYHYVVEVAEGASLPCGVISRWPIMAWGTWHDSVVGNRNPLWAIIDVPHLGRKLQVVSTHLFASGTATHRNTQANTIINGMAADFDPFDYTVLAGDLNTQNRSEAALTTLAAWVSDDIVPRDQQGNPNTNAGRNRPYDYVLPSLLLESLHRPLDLYGLTFADGAVFDTRIWAALPHPILASDSAAPNMQHMAVLKYFVAPTNTLVSLRDVNILDTGDGGYPLLAGSTYGLELEWFIGGIDLPEAVEITVASLSPDLTLAGTCITGSVSVVSPGTLLTALDCLIEVEPDAINGEHHLEITFAFAESVWTETTSLTVHNNDFIAEAVDTPGWSWTHAGDWFYQTNITADGVDAVLSRKPGPSNEYWIETTVEGPGQIVFDWWLSGGTQPHTHYLIFTRAGLSLDAMFWEGWSTVTHHIVGGTQVLRWTHLNYGTGDTAGDAVIDQVRFLPYTNQLLYVSKPNDRYHFTANSVIDADQHLIYIQNREESPMAYEIEAGSPWITIPLASGTVQGPLSMGRPYNYDLTLLTEGVYTSRVYVVAPGADEGEQSVEWTTLVQPPFAHEELPDFLSWSSGGVHGSWTITNDVAFGEVLVLQSAPASWHHSSWLVAEVAGPGQVDFDWRFTAENGGMELRLNGELFALNPVSGVQESIAVPIPPGTHRLEWRFFEQSFEYAAHFGQVIGLTYEGEPDRDGDGLPDWWETLHFGDPTAADPMVDSDGDGFSNWEEFVAGTDPHDSNSYFRVEFDRHLAVGPHVFFPHSHTNRYYRIIGSETLLSTNWIPLSGPQVGTDGPLLLLSTNASTPVMIRGAVSLSPDE